MNVARLFYAKQAHRAQSAPQRRRKPAPARRMVLLEPLEPRLLLSADPLIFAADVGQVLDLTLRLHDEAGTSFLELIDNTDADPATQVVASKPLADTSAVEVTGGDGDDRLTIDLAEPLSVPVVFRGGEGTDTLIGPGGADTWNITGAGAGTVNGVSFDDLENLTGAADNEDTFVFEASGGLSGVVDGGAGGFDALIVNGTFDTLVFTPTGPDSGSVGRDGDVIRYAGLEPLKAGTAADVIFNGTAGVEDWVLEDSPTAGQIQVRSTSGAIETTSFNKPSTLTFNLDTGADTLLIQSLGDSGFSADVTVNAGGDHDVVTVDAAVTGTGTYTLHGDGGNDTVILQTFSTAATYVIDGDAGAGDTVQATATGSQDASLGDAELVLGAETLSLAGIEVADLSGGGGSNTFTISDWSGTARLNGQGGDDIYKFGDGSGAATDDFGTVELTNDASEGSDTIDFTGHDGALSVSTTGFTNDTITSSDGSKVTQFVELAEKFDADLPVGAIAAIETFLDDLLDYVGKLQDGAEGFGQIFNQLPFIDGSADGSIGELTGLTGAITDFVNKAKIALSAQTTLSAVVSALNGITSPGAPFDVWTFSVNPNYRGSDPDASDSAGALELLLDFDLHAEVNAQTFKIDLGEEGASLGVNFDANISVDATLDADFSVGISTGAPLEVFLVPGGTITLAVDALADISGSSIHVGFLDLSIGPLSSIALDGQVEVQFVDDAATPDQRIDLAAVVGGSPTLDDVTDITISDPDLTDPYLEVDATIDVAAGVLVGGADLHTATINLVLDLSGSDPFGDDTEASTPQVTTLEATLPGPLTIDLLKFGNVSPTEVMGMLGGVLDTFATLASSQFMNVVVPFTGKTVGDILDYAKSFKGEVLDPLFLSGDFLAPDANNDGAVSLPFFDNDSDGDVDATDASLAELKIGSIQDLVGALADNLDIPGLKASFDGGELTFSIDFFRAFGLGDGDVTTTTQGDDPSNIDEVQNLTYTQASVDAFRLAFRDGAGALKITTPIDAKDSNGVPLASAAIRTAIDSALEALSGIGGGNVTVAGGGVVDGKRSFTITFDDSLGNVPQLGFAGELPLDFGASLGDFLGFSTSGSFGMAGILDTGLTFGIDLNPDTPIQIIPPVFAPSTVQVSTQTNGVDGATDEVLKVRIVEAVGKTYQLAFRATEGSGTFTLIGAPITVNSNLSLLDDDLQAALTAALGAANDPVVTADPSDPRLLTVTFNATSGTNHLKNVELTGVREAGILSGAAAFDVSLYNLPAIGIETFTAGGPSASEVQKVHILNATGGTFTLSFGGEETGAIAYGAPAGGVGSVLEALEALGAIAAGDVSVTKTGDVYTVSFQNGLANTNVAPLTANAKSLANGTALGSISVSVARDTTNTSIKDLARDVQAAIDQELYDADLSIGFNPALHASPGSHTTGVIAAGATFTAADTPFGGGALPSDLSYTIVLPTEISVTTTTNGVNPGTDEVQQVFIDAKGGTFTLSDGVTTTAALAYNAAPTNVQAALQAIYGVDKVQVAQVVSDLDGDGLKEVRYTVTFDDSLGNVAPLIADGSKLEAHTFTGQVRAAKAQEVGLAAALQAAVNSSLSSTNVTVAVGTNAGKLTITNALTIGVQTVTEGDDSPVTNEVQKVMLRNAAGGTFKLSFGGEETGNIDFGAPGSGVGSVQAALEGLTGIGVGDVSVTKTGNVYTVTFQGALAATNVAPLTANASGLVQADSDLELRFKSAIQVSSGGGRISLDAPLVKTSFSTLEPAVEVQRRIEITVDYSDPAFQEMAIASAPTRFDGKISDSIDLTLKVNGTNVHLTLAAGTTAGNTNLDQLVGQLRTAVDSSLGLAGFASGDIIVKRLAVNPDDPSSPKGNRIVFEGKSGVVTELAVFVPDSSTNGAITELGFAAGQSDTKRSKASSFFLEDVSFGGNFGLFENEVQATASLGLLAVTAEMTGTVDVATGKFFGADVAFDLTNPLDGGSRVTVDLLTNAINDGKFLFQPGDAGGTPADPATGFIDGAVSGGLGLTLALEPDGAIAGLPVSLGSIAVSAQSPNWLLAPPSLSNPFHFAKTNQSLAGPGVTVTTTGSNALTQDMIFVLSQTVSGSVYETPVIVRAADTVGNANAAALEADIQAAVDRALARLQRQVDKAGVVATVATVDAAVSGSNVTFATLAANDASAVNARGLFLDIDFTQPAGLEELLDSLKNLSFDDIIAVLRTVVSMLQNLDGSSDGSPLADVFGFKIPVIDRSIGDLVDLSGDFLDFVNDLVANPAGSLQGLETRLRSLLGLPPIVVPSDSILSFDTTGKILNFDFGFSSSASAVRPFNLDLADAGLGIFSQLVGLSASGNLGVQANVDLNLKLGLDLEGTDKAFFIDVDDTSLSASASAFGNNLEFEASLGPVGVFVIGGSASLDGSFTVNLNDAGASSSDGRLILLGFDGSGVSTDLGDLFDFLDMDFTGTGEVVLPVFYGLQSSPAPMGDPGQTQVFSPPTHFTGLHSLAGNELGLFVDLEQLFDTGGSDGLELRMPSFDFGDLSLPSLFSLLSDPGMIVKGLNSVLKEIQGVLEGQLFGIELPLIGDVLADNPVATFIEDFRLNFLQPLADQISESNLNLDGLIGLVEDVIGDVFGSLGILDTLPDHKFLDADGNEVPVLQAQALQFEFDLGDSIQQTLADINLSLPIPILGLSGMMEPTLTVAWNLHFGFGLDLEKGFYFVTNFDKEAGDPDGTAGKGVLDPELSFDLTLDLDSADGTPAELEANLAILKLALTDGVDLDKSGVVESDEYTRLFLNASLDLVDLRGGGAGGNESDGKLTIPELITQSPLDTFVFDIHGGASLLAHGVLSFGGLDASLGLSLASVLPSISTDLIVNFDIGFNSLTGLDVNPPEVVLANISLDLGDFIGGFAGDLLNTIGDILDPLAWLIGPDGLLNLRIPLISDLLGETVRIRDLINIFDPEDGPKVNAFLDFVEQLYFLTDLVDDAAGAGVLNFGDFVLFKNDPGSSFFDAFSSFIDHPFELGGLGAFGGDLRDVPNLNNLTLPDVDDADLSSQPSTTQSFTAGVTKPGSIDFPILKPETIFGLLLGKPATLFTIEFPELGFEFMYRQVIPIIGPLAATFAGKIGGTLDLGFGYDTLGITQLLATKNPAYLLNGFFLNDVDPATGFDRPEATFSAEIAVGAALSLGIATVGVEGGIGADIFFNLNDPDQDTKVRFAELASNIIANDGNPLAIFDIHGIITFFLRAYIEVLFFEASFEFARVKLFDFDIPFERPGVLASQQGSTLTLNIGPSASGRIQGDTSDGNEEIHVKTIADGTVVVWSNQFNVTEGIASTNPFTGVSKIVVNGGEGEDVIDLSGVGESHGVVAEVHGGAGIDHITGGGGADLLFGDDGNDVILGGLGADIIRGGRGDDDLQGGGGTDELYGEEGKDTLEGGAEADLLAGGLGNDEFKRSSGADTIDLGDSGSIDLITGGGGTPILNLSDKTVPVTVFVKDDHILVGFGRQNVSTSTILSTGFTFTTTAQLEDQFAPDTPAFEHMIGVIDASDVSKIIGSSEPDTFYVQETTSALTLDGGTEADTYFFYADPTGSNPIDVTVEDVGEHLKDENVIQVIGSASADTIVVTDGDITLDAGATQVVAYVPPSSDPNDFTDQLIIKVFGNGGADDISVESTFVTVPVRVEGGGGDDVVTVGDGTLNDLDSFLNANANDGFGFGPLVLVGGGGHDTVILDDSADGDNADNVGNISAFLEKREGVPGLVEVGVVSGLGMKMTVPEVGVVDGHVEFEGFEVADVRMGTGADTFTIGGALNLDSTDPDGGTWEPLTRTDAQVPKTRLPKADRLADLSLGLEDLEDMDPAELEALPGLFGILQNADTISGMTIVQGGGGEDDVRVLRTQSLPDQQHEVSSVVTTTELQAGDRNATPTPLSEIVRIDIRANVGYFVLEFADRSLDDTDPSTDDTVPGAEQTIVLPYDLTAGDLKDALAALRLVGGTGFIDDVSPTAGPLGPGVVRSYTVTFSPQLDNLPNLRALDTKLLVAGEGGDDTISVQSIDQPTYVLGGSVGQLETLGDDFDNDTLNVNVQIGINGPELASAPDGLNEIPPAKAVSNGVNAHLTVDGGVEGDTYFVYLFGGDTDSQINLFDSGGTTDDAAIVLGTDQSDMFLLRAAVANDGLAFVAMIKPPQVPVLDSPATHVERVNYRGSLDSMKIFALEGDDTFGIDDTRLDMEIYGGEGEDFFQVGQLYKSARNAAAGVPFADVFATLETTRGFLSNGISSAMKIFGGEDNDQFVVYHNLAPLALFGNDGDDSFLIRAFALVGSQEDLRERTDVSGDAGADLIQYAVNAPVNIDGGDGFDTIIVIGTEFNDDFVITEDGIFGAGLNVQFVRVETVEVDGDAGDDRFFILGTRAGVLTKITGSLGSDTFFGNGPTPDVVSNDLLGHSGLISHTVDSSLPPADSEFSGIKVVGIAANVADDDEPAVRITISDGTSIVSQVDPLATDHYTVVLTRKPEHGTKVVVTSRAPAGVKFTKDSDGDGFDDVTDGLLGDGGDSVAFTFDDTNWNVPQAAFFTAFQTGSAEIQVANDGGNGENARQSLAIQATEGSFKLGSGDADLGGPWTTGLISFDIRGDGKASDGDDADLLNREQELDQLRDDIAAAINAVSSKTAAVTRVRTTFFIEFAGTADIAGTVDDLALSSVALTFNDIAGTSEGFITHQVTLKSGEPKDSISNLFVQGKVAAQLDGKVQVILDTEGGGGMNEVQLLEFDASDGNFKIRLGDQVSEEMLFIPLDPGKVRDSIDNAINAFAGIDATVTKIGAAGDFSYRVEFNGASANLNVDLLQVEDSNLTKGERTLKIVGGLPQFIINPDGDGMVLETEEQNLLRGATVKVVAGTGIGQTRLVISNTADSITVANPWIEALDETSRIEILRYEGVVLPSTLVQIVGDDGRSIDLRETGGDTVAFEAPEVHGFVDANSNGLDDNDSLGFVDTVTVSLTRKPSSDVTVALDAADSFGNPQLFFAVRDGAHFKKVDSLTFDDNDAAANAWSEAQTVYVFGDDDLLTEGFHKAVMTLTANGGGYVDVVNSVVVDIADNEVALAMVLESAHSTDVVETGNFFNGGVVPANDVDGDNAASDTYQIVLSKAPQAGETVTVNLIADPTRTQRGAGILGIRAFDPEVALSSASLDFHTGDWFTPRTVTVTAAPDTKVEGDDSKSFATRFNQANSIEGPLVITGGVSEDRSADLEREPVVLPGETNFKPSIGTVQSTPAGQDPSFTLTIDLNEVIPGDPVLDTRLEGGTRGVLKVSTNTNGDPGLLTQEVQLLTVDAVSGTFRLTFDGADFTADITYDPADPDAVATDIESELNALPGATAVSVAAAGTAFVITFSDTDNHDPIGFADSSNALGENDLVRVGTAVDDSNRAEQVLTVFGNGGSFKLSLDAGLTKTAAIGFTPDDTAVNQAQVIEDALNALGNLETVLGAGASVTVSGSGTTYIVTFVDASNPIPALAVTDESLRVDEVQTLTLNASLGTFKLTLDGTPGHTTAFLPAGVAAAALESALEALDDVTDVTVRKDAEAPFYTIIFTGPGGENVNQLQVVDSTLARTVKEALETNLDITLDTPEVLKGFTSEITRGDAKNKIRIIIGGADTDTDGNPATRLVSLEFSRPWEAGLTDEVPSFSGGSEFTIEKTNPNLLVDENEETDFFFLNDTDNVASISELPTAELIVRPDHLSGLGMGGDQIIGGILHVEGGIQYTGLEELIVNLGPGGNRVIIEDTQPGATTINAGGGSDQFFVKKVSGHTFLNAGTGADTINVSDGSLLSGINALLTVSGDVPRAVALTLGKGSAPDPVALIGGVDEIQQITVEATGGRFQAGFIVDGVRYFTPLLDHDVSAADLQSALQNVVEAAFGVDDTIADVQVTRGGNVYRVTFTDQVGEQDVPLMDINDLGLTAETGAAPGDVLNIDNSAETADTQAVLTQTSLTGLGMGDLGTPGTTFNEIQTLRIDATGGTFTLAIDGTTIASAPLAFDISAAGLDAALEDMFFEHLNNLRTAAGLDEIELGDVAGGLVEVARNDDVYVIRFVGLLSNANVARLTANDASLTRSDELPGGALATVPGQAETATRLDGITAQNQNEIQKLTITATGGTFTLAFPSADAENVTAALPFDVSRAQLQLALEALPGIVPGDVLITAVAPGQFDIEFTGELSSIDVAQMIVDTASLSGGTATIATTQIGRDTGLNDVQVLTVRATAGTFRLELFLPAIQKTLVTEALAFDASSEQVRQALQDELARKLNGLNDDADLSRTREAFKSDFSVARVGGTYIIGFQGVTRQLDGGQGVSLLKVIGDAPFNASGGAAIGTRMDGINYYGFEQVNIHLGSGTDILNVQGTSAGSFKGINAALDAVHAATNITLAAGNDQVFVSSNADLDHATIFTTGGEADVFEFLTGDLNAISGNLNLDLGTGRHRLLISDEAATAGDRNVTITDVVGAPTGSGGFDTTGAAEIQVRGLAFGDITYGADAAANLFDGVIYWSGSGDDTIFIDGTHTRAAARTMTLLNTGLGDDSITVDLDNAGDDGFFALDTMGGAASVSPVDPGLVASDDDTVRASASTLPLVIFGGLGDDDIIAGQNKDVVFGDFGRVQYLDGLGNLIAVLGFGGRGDMISSQVVDPSWVISRDLELGGVDILEGGLDEDILIGGPGGHSIGDYIDGDAGDDLIFGDIVRLLRRDTNVSAVGDITNARFQTLKGQMIYSRTDLPASLQGLSQLPSGEEAGQVLVSGLARSYRNQDGSVPSWAEYVTIELYHSFDIEAGLVPGLVASFGDDYIAGGANHDEIFGQLGDDIIQGDGAIEGAVGVSAMNRITHPQQGLAPVGARRLPAPDIALTPSLTVPSIGTLQVTPSFESVTDGDDYIEGGGGDDVVFGGLGQDDIIGGSSSLFTLTTAALRPDGEDIIFGGAGTRIDRNHLLSDANRGSIVLNEGHGRDSDAIAGDNANIYRLVGINGTSASGFLQFGYDQSAAGDDRGSLRIVPRAVELLDYTPGGSDFDSARAAHDIGGADEVHGESGDDSVYGMRGDDVLFGDSEDDDLIGGWGDDWISGGTGSDGALGDDGRIFTGRYQALDGTSGVPDPANATHYAELLNGVLKVDVLNKTISTPGNLQIAVINPTIDGTSGTAGQIFKAADLTPFNLTPSDAGFDDPLFAPVFADDILYGGLGKDFLHGGSGDDAMSGAEALPSFFAEPTNPGNVLRYGMRRAGEFFDYDEFNPRTKLNPFLLNFATNEGVDETSATYGTKKSDGNDVVFGDLGNDWLVGGTGKDTTYGGWGDDLLNADDDLDGQGGLNDMPDTHPSYEDRAYGGAGRDVLIGNTGGDRLIDWIGEFNSYLVPFAPFGEFSVSRTLMPHLFEFLYELSFSQGVDPTRAPDTGNDLLRHGEPDGEIGLVIQKDPAWLDQNGPPADPQAGNIPGGKRDVLRSADFNNTTSLATAGFAPDSGSWAISGGALQVSAALPAGDSVGVFYVDQPLPSYFELQASVKTMKPTGGWKANAYLIFDYQGKSDFKFAGIDASLNKLVMGHRTSQGWVVDAQSNIQAKPDTYYNLLLMANGTTATLVVDGVNAFSYTFAPRVIAGRSYGLNMGLVGVGSDNARGTFDNVRAQKIPPPSTFQNTEDFADGVANLFTGSRAGVWQVLSGRYGAAPASGGDFAFNMMNLGLGHGLQAASSLELSARLSTQGMGGIIFDQYGPGDFKFVAIDKQTGNLVVGHHTDKRGWVVDAASAQGIRAGIDYDLKVSLKGTTVSVSLNGQIALGYAFNSVVVDGNMGLFTRGGSSSFGTVGVLTDDPGFASLPAILSRSITATDVAPLAGSTLLGQPEPTSPRPRTQEDRRNQPTAPHAPTGTLEARILRLDADGRLRAAQQAFQVLATSYQLLNPADFPGEETEESADDATLPEVARLGSAASGPGASRADVRGNAARLIDWDFERVSSPDRPRTPRSASQAGPAFPEFRFTRARHEG